MQTALTFRTNRDLFSNHYLDEHLPETEEWDEVGDDELEAVYDDIRDLWEREKTTAPKRNEPQLEEKFIRPMFRRLGIPFEVEESTSRTQRRPDYGFFDTEDAARAAFGRREEGGDFYENAVAVADAKRWGRPLDTRGSGEHDRDFENPSYQIHVYLQETPARWAVLTDGRKWRLYYGPTSHRFDSYYEVDLPTVLKNGDLEDFKYFYLFFRHEAFLEDAGGDCFLDDVYDQSNAFARELGEDLQDNIYEAIEVLAEGFLQYPDNDLGEDDLDLIHDSSLIYLYRLIFVLYAEAEGRELLDTSNEIYEQSYSLNSLKQEIAEELDSGDPKYRDWQDDLQSRLDELFTLIDKGSKSLGIPEEDLYVPAYNGGLFRTDPDEADNPEAKFLADHDVGDVYLAKVVELLTRSENSNGGGKIFVDYSSLDVRHLGSIYEGLLEYELEVADEPLALDDGEYVSADEGDDVVVKEGAVYLTTGSGERKATGSYYTPEYIVEYIVENTLEPLVEDIRADLAGRSAQGDDRGFAAEFAERVFELNILDPSMGSGHFFTGAIDYLAREIIAAQEKQAAQQGLETVDEDHDINWARRQVAQRCIYGVDLNPLAVELAKVSLWLRTLAAEQPLAFLDHHLKTGNSLVGSNVEEIDALERNGTPETESPNSTLIDFGVTFEGTMENLMAIHSDIVAIENQELDDMKAMEEKYGEFEANVLRRRLEAIVDVYTAEEFDADVPNGAYEQMAKSLKSDRRWEEIQSKSWFIEAQELTEEKSFFNWRLEYPDVFYDDDGGEKENPGFDVVLGNPPYINAIELNDITTHEKDLWKKRFDSAKDAYDIYILFLEQSLELSRESGFVGLIVPNKHLSAPYAEAYREYIIDNHQLWKVCDVSQLDVFEDPSVYPVIPFFETDGDFDGIDDIEIDKPVSTVPISTESEHTDICSPEKLTKIGNDPWGPLLLDLEEQDVFWSAVEGTTRLDDQGTVQASSTASEAEEFTVALSEDSPGKTKQRFIKTGGIDPFQSFWNSEEVRHQGEYYTKPVLDVSHPVITDLRKSQYESEKLIFAKVASILEAFVDANGEYASVDTNLFYDSKLDVRYYGAVLNSTAVLFLYSGMFGALRMRGGDFQFQAPQLKQIPVPSISIDTPESEREDLVSSAIERYDAYLEGRTSKPEPKNDDVAHDFLAELADRISELKRTRNDLSLPLLDYLGIPASGIPEAMGSEPLRDSRMPAPGVADTPLAETAESSNGLRIEGVTFDGDDSKLVMSTDISYKPDDDQRQTDRYGRLVEDEFETYDAMVFTGLSDEKRVLIECFVREAVSRAGGFAGFRRSATKTISPLDRLQDIVLPELDAVKNGLKKYEAVRQSAAELQEKIEKTEQLIDEIVYDLYELTDEEIEIVESAVRDD